MAEEKKYDVVFVLGGPGKRARTVTVTTRPNCYPVLFLGAGKGTNCARIVTTFGYTHLSTEQKAFYLIAMTSFLRCR